MKLKNLLMGAALLALSSTLCAPAHADSSKTEKRVFFENLKDGDKVSSPLTVKMGVEGVALAPAGETKDGTGHHHIIVDGGPMETGQVVPTDPTHLHFGKGQTETTVTLTPGEHTLTLQLADGAHRSYGKELSSTVHITVQ